MHAGLVLSVHAHNKYYEMVKVVNSASGTVMCLAAYWVEMLLDWRTYKSHKPLVVYRTPGDISQKTTDSLSAPDLE